MRRVLPLIDEARSVTAQRLARIDVSQPQRIVVIKAKRAAREAQSRPSLAAPANPLYQHRTSAAERILDVRLGHPRPVAGKRVFRLGIH